MINEQSRPHHNFHFDDVTHWGLYFSPGKLYVHRTNGIAVDGPGFVPWFIRFRFYDLVGPLA